MVCGCQNFEMLSIFVFPMLIGMFVGLGIDNVYFQTDRMQYVNENCEDVERINIFTCSAFAETVPLWVIIFPFGFIGLSFIIHFLFYNIQDLLNDRHNKQKVNDVD